MNTRRIVLTVLSGLLAVGGVILLTVDVHADQRDCGSAILTRDTSELGVNTGNVANDDFATQEVLDDCAHELLGIRMLCGGMFVAALGLLVVARRRRRPRLDLPGGPVI
jgi:chloramphenicol 3-O-phosphotransferase